MGLQGFFCHFVCHIVVSLSCTFMSRTICVRRMMLKRGHRQPNRPHRKNSKSKRIKYINLSFYLVRVQNPALTPALLYGTWLFSVNLSGKTCVKQRRCVRLFAFYLCHHLWSFLYLKSYRLHRCVYISELYCKFTRTYVRIYLKWLRFEFTEKNIAVFQFIFTSARKE